MSTILTSPARPVQPHRIRPLERMRGKWGMWLFIATEATLFALLFFAYFYLGSSKAEWPREDPSLRLPLVMLGVLLTSSAVLSWGEKGIERGNVVRLRAGLAATLILGLGFLVIQSIEYAHHLEKQTPQTDAYASIFYTITSFHAAHVLVGLLMLLHVFARALAGHFDEHRHLAVQNASLYWHFVDVVWLLIVGILYVSPRFYG